MGFNILAFPCNQFGEQEPEACPAIKRFAQAKGVEFTMMDKVDVNDEDAHPVYDYLKKVAGPVSHRVRAPPARASRAGLPSR